MCECEGGGGARMGVVSEAPITNIHQPLLQQPLAGSHNANVQGAALIYSVLTGADMLAAKYVWASLWCVTSATDWPVGRPKNKAWGPW